MMLALVFLDALSQVRNFPYIPSLLRKIFTMNGYWILLKAFLYLLNDCVVFVFYPINMVCYINWFSTIKPTLHSWVLGHGIQSIL